MIARLLCKFLGHKRGKRVPDTDDVRCPRCSATWPRPRKAKAS